MAWTELSFEATNEAVDWVYTLLAGANYTGEIQIKQLSKVSTDHTVESDRALSEFTCSLHLYLPNAAQSDVDRIDDLFSSLYRTGMISTSEQTTLRAKPDFSESADAPITRIGNRLTILSDQGMEQLASNQNIIIRLKPTLAFGSGFHPATRLTLRLLERLATPGMAVLDLGSGSGILTVAAAKLGADVVALDNDHTAVEATQSTVELNGVAAQVMVIEGSLGQGSDLGHWMGGEVAANASRFEARDRFDLIVANIFARVHIALAADFRQALRPSEQGGWLIAAGFTADYEPEITTAFAQEGFTVVECERMEEWVAIAFRVGIRG